MSRAVVARGLKPCVGVSMSIQMCRGTLENASSRPVTRCWGALQTFSHIPGCSQDTGVGWLEQEASILPRDSLGSPFLLVHVRILCAHWPEWLPRLPLQAHRFAPWTDHSLGFQNWWCIASAVLVFCSCLLLPVPDPCCAAWPADLGCTALLLSAASLDLQLQVKAPTIGDSGSLIRVQSSVTIHLVQLHALAKLSYNSRVKPILLNSRKWKANTSCLSYWKLWNKDTPYVILFVSGAILFYSASGFVLFFFLGGKYLTIFCIRSKIVMTLISMCAVWSRLDLRISNISFPGMD